MKDYVGDWSSGDWRPHLEEELRSNDMQRTLDNFQEIGWLADNGKLVRTLGIAEFSVSIIKQWTKDEQGQEIANGYKATMMFSSARTQETLAIYEREFSDPGELLDLLGIQEDEEVWEVLE